jgi:pyruvate dehydrogenase E1 component beta subunit
MQDRCFDELDGPIQRVAMRDIPMAYSRLLEKALIPTSDQIVEAVRRLN